VLISATLRKRNINARPTDYVRRIITAEKLASGKKYTGAGRAATGK